MPKPTANQRGKVAMNRLSNVDYEEERLPLWLMILMSVAAVGAIALLLVFFFNNTSP